MLEDSEKPGETDDVTDASSSTAPTSKSPKHKMSRYRSFVRWYMRGDLFRTILHFIHLGHQHLPSDQRPIPVVDGDSTKPTSLLINTSSSDEHSPLLNEAKQATPPTSKLQPVTGTKSEPTKARGLWISGRAIPLGDQDAIQRAIRLDGFLDGLKDYANTLLPAAFFALLAHDIACYRLYPQDRYGNVLWKIFAGLSPNQQTLTSYFNEFWWWPFTTLVGVPLFAGSYQVLRRHNWHLRADDVYAVANYEPNILRDLFTYPLPSPFATTYTELDRTTTTALWNMPKGQIPREPDEVTSKHRVVFSESTKSRLKELEHAKTYLQSLVALIEQQSQNLIRLYALSCLAEFTDGRRSKDLAKLRHARVDSSIIDDLIEQRKIALNTLSKYAHYRLPRKSEGRKIQTSLIRFLYVNHLLWKIGHGERSYLDPLFWSYNLTKDFVLLYAKLRMLYAAGYFVYKNVKWLVDEKRCQKEHKIWTYVAAKADYDCTVCGDQRDIYYAHMYAAQTCLDAVLAKPRNAAEILHLIRQVAPFNFTRLDFSHQNWASWDPDMWWQILSNVTVTANKTALVELNLAAEPAADNTTAPVAIPGEHAQILGNFLQSVTVQRLSLRGYELDNVSSALLVPNPAALPEGTLLELDLSRNPTAVESLPVLLELLPNSTQKLLLMDNQLTDSNLVKIAPSFARFDKLLILDLSGNRFGVSGLNATAEYVGAQIQELDISGSDLAQANLTTLGRSLAGSDLRSLWLHATGITDRAFVSLVPYLPQMRNLQYFDVSGNQLGENSAYALIGILNFTSITSFNCADNPLGDYAIITIGKALIGSKVIDVNFGNTQTTDFGMQRLCLSIPDSGVIKLNVSNNAITYIGLKNLAQVIPKIQLLDCSGNLLRDNGAKVLGEMLTVYSNHSLSLFLAGNDISENGAVMLSQAVTPNRLAVLDISHNPIHDQGMLAFLQVFNHSRIRQFKTAYCGFTSQNIGRLAEILSTTQLREVDLHGNQFGDDGVIKLAGGLIGAVPYKNTLGDAYISRDQLRALDSATPTTLIRKLSFSFTNTTIVGGRALCRVLHASGIPEPAALGLEGNPIDSQQLDITTCIVSAGASVQPLGANVFAFIKWSFADDRSFGYSESPLQRLAPKWVNRETPCRSYPNKFIEDPHLQRYELLRICLESLPSDITKQTLHCVLAVALALRQEIGAEILRYLPRILRDVIYQQLQGPGGELLNISSELVVRAQTSGISAFVYDATLVTKSAYQKQRRDEEKHSNTIDNKWTHITGNVAAGLAAIAGVYGMARATTFATGSAVLGCLMPSIIFNANKIVTEVTTAYQQSGLLSAIDAGIDAVVFSFPGGAIIERSLNQQSEALSRFGVFKDIQAKQNVEPVIYTSCSSGRQ